MSELVISILGTFQITRGFSGVVEFEYNKVRALLAYLAVESDRPHTRDALAALLWPESAQEAALKSLLNALASLRRSIGDRAADPPYLLITRETVQFNPASDTRLDAAGVIRHTAALDPHANNQKVAIQPLVDAVNSYRGPFLEGFSIPDSAAFEEWASLRREQLEQWTLKGLRFLADYYEACGDTGIALEFARRQVALEPWIEEGHRQVMRLLARSGQPDLALRQYQALCETLRHDLAAEPTAATVALSEAIRAGEFNPPPAKKPAPTNLPVQTTSFIGREKEVETLKTLILSGKSRLVTVTGAGGTGKTRLALRAAEALFDAFPQGIWLVEFGAVTDPNLVPATVAAALNLREVVDRPFLQVVVDYLRPKRSLLLLDTCEHLVGAVASLADQILRAAPAVAILATSREILGVSGEMPFICPSLSLPTDHLAASDALIACEAVRLFSDRSALAAPAFTITEKNAPIVAQVCRRLDGIPLAIELAAARTRLLSIEQIAERLDHAFQLLTGGSRTALPRHQTLRAMIDWSYNLLSPAESDLLRRLSVFIGGWTLAAAEAVCAGDCEKAEILDRLGRLADKSLILVEPGIGAEPRYRMLDTIRQYARDRLAETGGETAVRDRHLAYYLHFAEEAEPHLRATGMVEWLNRLEVDLDNIRQALDWAMGNSVEKGLRMAASLHWFWHIRSHRLEGSQWLEQLLEADTLGFALQLRSQASKLAHGKALSAVGSLNHQYPGAHKERSQSQLQEAVAIFQDLGNPGKQYLPAAMYYLTPTEEKNKEYLSLAIEVGDELYAAEYLGHLRYYSFERGDLQETQQQVETKLAIHKKIGDADGEGYILNGLAQLEFFQGNSDHALMLWENSQECLKRIGNYEHALLTQSTLIWIVIFQGDYRRALQLGELQLAGGLDINSRIVIIEALGNIGRSAWALDDDEYFKKKYKEILDDDGKTPIDDFGGTLYYVFGRMALSQRDFIGAVHYLKHLRYMDLLISCLGLQALGNFASATGEAKKAAVIFSSLASWCSWLHNTMSPKETEEYEKALEAAQAALGCDAFEEALDEGAKLEREALFGYLTEWLGQPAA